MDKSCHSSGEPLSPPPPTVPAPAPTATAASTISGKDPNYLKQLHKSSHKISKPPIRKPSSFDYLNHHPPLSLPLPPPPQPPVVFDDEPPSQPPSNQPPVYNINKSDFRDVVQKLTGSTAHSRAPAPQPPQPPMLHHHSSSKPQSSRLQRIRPPPLENLTNRPSSNPCFPAAATSVSVNFFGGQRPPLSPLPPFPTVHAAAESPVSAYMRYLKAADSAQPNNNNNNQTSTSALPPLSFPMLLPSSPPPPCGFLPSPKSPYPTNQFGFQPFPLSPTLPLPSPRWEKGL